MKRALAAAAVLSLVLASQQKIYWGDDVPAGWAGKWPQELQTIPERTGFTRTVTSLQLHEYIVALKAKSDRVHVVNMFTSPMRKVAPAIVLSNPRVTSAQQARASGKPVVVSFVGAAPAPIEAAGAFPAATLADAARLAVALARGEPTAGPPPAARNPLLAGARARPGRLAASQRYVRGLYSGGTLCQEAALILEGAGGQKHTTVDLGDDEFTVGRPHPMIDFRLRNERILAAAGDGATAVILLDVVLGYGAHPDPAGALVPAIEGAIKAAAKGKRGLAFVASVCGTPADPQGLERQETRLAAAGVLLAPSNAQAARLAASLVGRLRPARHRWPTRRKG